MADEAVLDAPELEIAEPLEQVEPQEEKLETEAAPEAEVDWRKVPANLREFFKTPEGKAAKDAWYERNAFKEKLPGGVKELEGVLGFLNEHGGQESLVAALGELKGQAEELSQLNELAAKGDPRIIDALAGASSESFPQLAAAMNQKWAQADPDGWGNAMSGVMAATIQQAGIPMFLERMGMLLEFGKTDDVRAAIAQLNTWSQSFGQKAQAPVQRTQQPNKLDAREQELNNREQTAFKSDVEASIDGVRTPAITKELEPFFKRRPGDEESKSEAIALVAGKVKAQLDADKDYVKTRDGFLARKDKAGYMKYVQSRESAVITKIAPNVGRLIFGNPTPPRVEKVIPHTAPVLKNPMRSKDRFDAIWTE